MSNKVFEDYWWCYYHPEFTRKGTSKGKYRDWRRFYIEIEPHLVCPLKRRIRKDKTLNTHLEYWIECGYDFHGEEGRPVDRMHCWELDCGGDSFEEAVSNLKELMLKEYGDYDVES